MGHAGQPSDPAWRCGAAHPRAVRTGSVAPARLAAGRALPRPECPDDLDEQPLADDRQRPCPGRGPSTGLPRCGRSSCRRRHRPVVQRAGSPRRPLRRYPSGRQHQRRIAGWERPDARHRGGVCRDGAGARLCVVSATLHIRGNAQPDHAVRRWQGHQPVGRDRSDLRHRAGFPAAICGRLSDAAGRLGPRIGKGHSGDVVPACPPLRRLRPLGLYGAACRWSDRTRDRHGPVTAQGTCGPRLCRSRQHDRGRHCDPWRSLYDAGLRRRRPAYRWRPPVRAPDRPSHPQPRYPAIVYCPDTFSGTISQHRWTARSDYRAASPHRTMRHALLTAALSKRH